MIVKYRQDLEGGPHHRAVRTGESMRFLVRSDGVGFTLTDTTVEPGSDTVNQYKNHLEANYVLEGEGTLEDLATGKTYDIRPGLMYTVLKGERHRVRATSRIRFICVFLPALVGTETHDSDGSYPLL